MSASILIVDDSLTVRMDLGEAFDAAGFSHVLCADLASARDAMKAQTFALIVLDVNLPDGDGIDFLKEIRGNPATAQTPVMLLSTAAEVQDRIRGLKIGADDYIGKPYESSYVISRARELVRSHTPPSAETRSARTTILVIDDSKTYREELKAMLADAGYDVAAAETGEEGLRLAVDLRPGAIIVDNMMPGIDGPTVIRRLKLDEALRRTPCILLTAVEDRNSELQAYDAGADAYVRKESDPTIILARLSAALRSAGTQTAQANVSAHLGPKRILAVDDSMTYLHQLADELRSEGYEPILAHSGEESLQLLAAQPVDCILMDLIMPGLSGEETCRRIKGEKSLRDIPLVMLTSMDESQAMIAGINAGADDHITKSGDFEVLKARLRAQLRRKQFEDENRRIREQLLSKEVEAAEARAAHELAETRAVLLADLERKNKELEAFSYSVSHDLRAPLRAIDGFTQALREDFAHLLPDEGKQYLERVCTAAQRMGELIDDLLELSRVTRHELRFDKVNLGALAKTVSEELQRSDSTRNVTFVIAPNLSAEADAPLMRIVLENLLGNAWKYTSKQPKARIEFGAEERNGARTFFVRDDGVGFDMAYVNKLFGAFQRLHKASEFPGSGIGLATVHRIIDRHEGRIWAEAAAGKGASFYFTLPEFISEVRSGLWSVGSRAGMKAVSSKHKA